MLSGLGSRVAERKPKRQVMNNCKEADKNIGAHKHQDEVKDAQIIFNAVWNELESEFGKERLHFSKS